MKKKSIRDVLGKPSAAIRAMVKGLKKYDKKKDYNIDMGWYGYYDESGGPCLVCAATCTVMEAMRKPIPKEKVGSFIGRLECLGLEYLELFAFEKAMNEARKKNLDILFEFFGYEGETRAADGTTEDWYVEFSGTDYHDGYMNSTNYKALLPDYLKIADLLESKGC